MSDTVSTMQTATAHLAAVPRTTIFGVKYLHLRLDDGSDLYVTEHGRSFTKLLLPENHWADKAWFAAHSEKLRGTSTLYRVTTKPVDGMSRDIVLKWNRMGQDIPGETTTSDLAGAEFNSPFEEFSLVLEFRRTRHESDGETYTHRPLAIYVPRKYVEPERLGRRRYRMDAIERTHAEIILDWNRNYAVIYEWIKGIDAAEALERDLIGEKELQELVTRADREMRRKGFFVSDNKPHHVIVRPTRNGTLARRRTGGLLFAMVDFELLRRTPEREQAIRDAKRKDYLFRQAHRFESQEQFPADLKPVTVMGVDYVYGPVQSTGGALWTVGRDPVLFDYFLPEKWRRTPRTKLSASHQVYHTITKDNINLVWRVSHVGTRPDMDPFVRKERRILTHGFNSPFEEFAMAMDLSRKGIETTYPRAIYTTGHQTEMTSALTDRGRYESHARLTRPDGHPILSECHEYILIWGYWNGPDEFLAKKDEQIYRGIDALAACREGRLTQEQYMQLMRATKKRLADAGAEDLNLRGTHLLLSLDRGDHIVREPDGLPMVRICNFELLKRVES